MKISVCIMSHPYRRLNAEALKVKLDGMSFKYTNIVYDIGSGEWDTGRRCIEDGLNKSDWHIVIQDDAIIGDTFFDNVYQSLLKVPDKSLVSFYLGKVRPHAPQVKLAFNRAYASDSSWLSMDTLLWGVCIAIPSDDIDYVLNTSRLYPNMLYDRRIGQVYKRAKRKVYYTTISLVDHDYTIPSLTGHDRSSGNPRVCHEFVGNDLLTFNSRCVAL